jgi:hypothetical protein
VPPFWVEKQLWPQPWPLYRLNELAAEPETPVVVAEGEKAADAAARIFPNSIATTSPSGAQSAHKADWSPLHKRDILLWPDNDKAGRDYMAAVTTASASVVRSIRMVDATKLAEQFAAEGERDGWDCADGLKAHAPEALRDAAIAAMSAPSSAVGGDLPEGSTSPEAADPPESPTSKADEAEPGDEEAPSSAYADLLDCARSLTENDDVNRER